MTWSNAWIRSTLVFVSVVVFIVIVPDFVVDTLSSSSEFIREAATLAVWGIAFVGGLWLLRRLQARGIV